MPATAAIPAKAGIQWYGMQSSRLWIAVFAGMTAGPAFAAESIGSAASMGSVLEVFGSLILVLIVIFVLAWLARALQGARITRGAAIRVQGGAQLGAKEKVVLLQVGDQQMLVGVAPGNITLLHRFETPIAPDAEDESAPTSLFAQRLKEALGGKRAS